MSETSQATPPAETGSPSVTPNPTATTPPTSSTTPPSQETGKSNGSEATALGTDPKAEGEERSKGEGKAEAKAKPEGPPEKYEFKAPEGYELDSKMIEEASSVFKEAGLSQSQADKLVGLYNKQLESNSNLAIQTVKDMRAGWVKQLATSPEYSKEFDASGKIKADSEVLVGIGRMLDSLGNAKLASEFRQALNITGAGDHPAVFSALHLLSKHFAEGNAVRGRGPSPFGQDQPSSRRSAAQEMYPKLPSAGA